MKKLLFALLFIAFASPSFAVIEIGSAGSDIGGAVYKPSKSVTVTLEAAEATYAAGAKHVAGTKGYGTINTDSKVSEFECDAGTDTKVTLSDSETMPTACEP